MWKRTDEGESTGSSPARSTVGTQPQASVKPRHNTGGDIANIGRSVVIKGELTGSESLSIEGQVEGTINLGEHLLTIGPAGKIKAQVTAESVVVCGQVVGDITAEDRIEIRENGSVEGDIAAPRVAIADGAHFRGSIDMQDSVKEVQAPKVPGIKTKLAAPGMTRASAVPTRSSLPQQR